MSPPIIFWTVLVVFLTLVIVLDKIYFMLRDVSTELPRPYSFARTQLTWWTIIVLTSFISILLVKKEVATLLESTLILLGMSSGTTVAARVIDVGDSANPNTVRHQDSSKSQGFLLDILSDESGVSIHRLQTIVLTITFGIWFLVQVAANLSDPSVSANGVIPDITTNNLILLGLSSGTYVGLKVSENRPNPSMPPEHVPDEGHLDQSRPVG